MNDHQIAQLNVARAVAPLDHPRMADFMALLDEINQLAERSPGFVWRYLTDSRDPGQRELADPRVLFNMSVWESVEALHGYAYKTRHGKVFAARKKWFAEWKEHSPSVQELGAGAPFLALWWVPAGHVPSPAEGIERLRLLATHGPGPQAFTFKQRFTPEGQPVDS